ncbi:MAG: response regulator [Saprospiraceae bacterium]|nr:response regulator [Saprospiraceae bacterium]
MKNNTTRRLLATFALPFVCLLSLSGQSDAVNILSNHSLQDLEQEFVRVPSYDNAQTLSSAYMEMAVAVNKRKHPDSIAHFLSKSQATWQRVSPQNAKVKAQTFVDIAGFYLYVKNYILADSFYTKANDWALQTGDEEYKCYVQMEWAYVKTMRGLMQDAANLVHKWQDKIEGFANPIIKRRAFQRVGAFYNAYGTPEKARIAIPYLRRGVEVAESYLGTNHPQMVFNLGILRNTYKSLGYLDSVIQIGKKLETLLPQLDPVAQIWVLMTNGNDYLSVNNLPKAKEYLNRTWALIETNNLQESDDGQYTLYLFGKTAIAEERYTEAENYLQRALVVCKKIDYKLGIREVLVQLVIAAEKQGNYQKQALYQKELSDVEVAIAKQNYANSIAKMEVQLNVVQKDNEINAQKSAQRLLLLGLLLMGLVAGLSWWFYLRIRKQQRELAEKNHLLAQQNQLIARQNKELTHLDEAKTRFFANVSHELRTPLTLILGPLASMIKRNRLENTDFTHAHTAQTHAKGLLKLVNEILDLSKIESGKMKVHDTTVSFQPFIRRLVSAFESHAERLGIHYQLEYRAEKRLRLSVDTEKLARIVNNLLSNAMKFTPRNGTITVVVEDLAHGIRIKVSDTGRGIHPDDLPNVFDRFYQTNQSDAPVEGGTGIGLALCREFAEVMDGRIWVESTLGQGSHFYFEFPKKEVLGVGEAIEEEELNSLANLAPPQYATVESPSDLRNLQDLVTNNNTVLIVEDNPDLRAYIATILRGAAYTIVEAENGLEALDFLQKQLTEQKTLPQLIISDIMMPEMDGFQLLKVLKDRDYFRGIPVVMLTARADIKDKLAALRIGVDDYLLKPFEEEELLARVENLLKNYQDRLSSSVATDPLSDESRPTDSQTPDLITTEQLLWLESLEQVIEKQMANFDLTAEIVADELAMSRAQFFRRLKSATGLTPNQYLLEVRFNHARHLLEMRKENSVKAVAYSVGMRDVKYFSQQFKERFGRLPSDYLS